MQYFGILLTYFESFMIKTHYKAISRPNFNLYAIFKTKKTNIETKEITLFVLLYILQHWERTCSKARLLGPTCALFTPIQYIAQRTVSRGLFKRNEIFISPGYSQS